MFNKARLKDALIQYKKDFISRQWEEEKYKWEAVKCFQDNWDVNAADFADMLSRSLSKTENLLTSANNFPARMIKGFAAMAPEKVRSMFLSLFDEAKDVYGRIEGFKRQASNIFEKYGNENWQHYQHENAITTYLWLRYPDKYYIYKFSEVKSVADELESDYRFKKGAYADNIRNFYKLYDEICEELRKDTDLIKLFQSQLTDSCYPDPQLRTLALDVGFYISRFYSRRENDAVSETEWFPADYDPGLSVEDWIALLGDEEVFTPGSLEIMKRLKDYGGTATCTQLSMEYGESANFYNTGSSALAKRIANKTGCPLLKKDTKNSKWWPVLYVGKYAGKDEDGVYLWKLRRELAKALDQVDLSDVKLYAQEDSEEEERGYWWLNANPKIWSYSEMAVGEVQSYTLYNDNGNKRRIFQNFLDAKAGDMVVGYESNPVKQIVALGKISAEQDVEEIFIEKLESLASPIAYHVLKSCPELKKMEFFVNPNGSLFKLTREEFDFIMDMIREENPVQKEAVLERYGKADFLEEVYMAGERYDTLVSVLRHKKNIILQGAPGVGKTFAARRLAYSLMGEKDDSRVEFVQFHQNYSYEDFMMGYKPVENGFELKYGVFYRFCQKAANHPDKDYFFIIDEINRGNLSKIFGELLMLIECGYRDTKITLAYNELAFFVPSNLYIIGMMNAADRSLAMMDYAFAPLRQCGYEDVEKEEFDNIYNLFAAILSKGISRQLKQGLYREYVSRKEDVVTMRGKIDMPGTIRNRLVKRHALACEFDELSEDNLFNQIIKTTVMLLLRHKEVKLDYKSELKKEMLFFSNVGTINPAAIRWQSIRFQRNSNTCRMLVGLCQLVLEGMLLTTDKGEYRLASFLKPEQMGRLYERFILEYYIKEHPEIHASASQIPWALDDGRYNVARHYTCADSRPTKGRTYSSANRAIVRRAIYLPEGSMSGGHGIMSPDIIPAPIRVRPKGGHIPWRIVRIPRREACPKDMV